MCDPECALTEGSDLREAVAKAVRVMSPYAESLRRHMLLLTLVCVMGSVGHYRPSIDDTGDHADRTQPTVYAGGRAPDPCWMHKS